LAIWKLQEGGVLDGRKRENVERGLSSKVCKLF
jgi:hypothetical protein